MNRISKQDVVDFILIFFREKGKLADWREANLVEINFVENKLLDSIEFITLISVVEENFNVVFSQENIQSPNFSSIEGMASIVSEIIDTQ